MNRTIKFRGKASRKDKDMWLYGDLIKIGDDYHILEKDDMIEDGHHVTQDSDRPTWVEEETIGQFTGLFDKNCKEIYEGDIVKHPYIDPIFRDLVESKDGNGVTSEVVFHDGAFCVKYDVDDFIYLDSFTRYGHIEVIGNKFDNPDLIKSL